jgi:glycosyltransferase involved in cell wall biosynthesis
MDAIRAEPPLVRRIRRAIARVLIPAHSVAWTVGEKNEEFWRDEMGLKRTQRIPFEVLSLPGGSQPMLRSRDSDSPLRVLYVGRLVAVKRVQDLILALKMVPGHLSWRLTVVGDGPERQALEQCAGESANITFTGSVPHNELDQHFFDADVLVLPSSYEPWGLVVNEALGFGLFTITSDAVGAASDLITPTTGAIYAVGNVPALAAAIEKSAQVTSQAGMGPRTDTAQLMLDSIRIIRDQRSR